MAFHVAATSTASSQQQQQPSSSPLVSQQHDNHLDSRFCCNICFDAVVDPVVTQCGHLYCWPCLYRWLEPGLLPEERLSLSLFMGATNGDDTRRACPVCKAPCSVTSVVPIYVVNDEPSSTNHEQVRTFANTNNNNKAREQQQQQPTNAAGEQRSSRDNETTLRRENDSDETTNETTTTTLQSPEHARDDDSDAHHQEEITDPTDSTTGIRFRTTTARHNSANTLVPARPAAHSPPRPTATTTSRQSFSQQQQPLLVNSLSRSLAHLQHYSAASDFVVPPVHRREGRGNAAAVTMQNSDPDATEFLSRILLLLGSFVILCLLLF
jgi:hypothetical protein